MHYTIKAVEHNIMNENECDLHTDRRTVQNNILDSLLRHMATVRSHNFVTLSLNIDV